MGNCTAKMSFAFRFSTMMKFPNQTGDVSSLVDAGTQLRAIDPSRDPDRNALTGFVLDDHLTFVG